jgi:transposase
MTSKSATIFSAPIPAEQKVAPDGTALVKIREEVTDEVDYHPGKLFRRQIIRPVYASPAHCGAPQIALLPPRVIPGGQVGPGLIAHVLLSKYVDHLPLCRQEAMLGRLGPAFTRLAMGEWVGQAAGLLQPVYHELKKIVRLSGNVQGDETPIQILNPACPGAAQEAWLWTFLAPGAKAVVFDFQLTRSHEPALAFLRDFRGAFQTDGHVMPGLFRPFCLGFVWEIWLYLCKWRPHGELDVDRFDDSGIMQLRI